MMKRKVLAGVDKTAPGTEAVIGVLTGTVAR